MPPGVWRPQIAVYLVTGGAGFIGSNIVEELLTRGETVRVIDNFFTGTQANLDAACRVGGSIDLLTDDIRDSESCAKACKGIDYIIHEAAVPSVPRSIADPMTSHEVNVTGTINLLMAARDSGVKRVVMAGSSSAYGDEPALPKIETMHPLPIAPYAASKLAAEHYCRSFFKVYGLETTVVRYFNVFGPRQNPESEYAAVIPKFIKMIMKGEPPTIYGDGEHSRDFTYIANTVAGTLAAATTPGAEGEIFNVACGDRYTLNQLIGEINNIFGTTVNPIYAERRKGDVPHSLASIDKAAEILGYEPTVDFKEGLRRTASWLRESLGISSAVAQGVVVADGNGGNGGHKGNSKPPLILDVMVEPERPVSLADESTL